MWLFNIFSVTESDVRDTVTCKVCSTESLVFMEMALPLPKPFFQSEQFQLCNYVTIIRIISTMRVPCGMSSHILKISLLEKRKSF